MKMIQIQAIARWRNVSEISGNTLRFGPASERLAAAAGPLVGGDSRRIYWVDALRGIAILCMIADHLAALYWPLWPVRYTVGRAALPLFMLCSGYLFAVRGRGPSGRRHLELFVFAVPINIGLWMWWREAVPDPLLVIGVAWLFAGWVLERPVVSAVVGLVVSTTLPLSPTYQPGYLVGLMALGVLWQRTGPGVDLRRMPLVEGIGRRPLTWYVAHLVLVLAVRAFVAGG
jgi:uncharacterized membrane protein